MDFYTMASSIKALRMYVNEYGIAKAEDPTALANPLESTSMNKEKYDAAVATFPKITQDLMDSSNVPTQEEIESAAYSLRGKTANDEDAFLGNYNNLIFL